MVYKVVFRDEARKGFERLDRAVREQVGRVIDRLADNPRPGQATQLVGDPRTWRVRAGDWRILYEIRDDEIMVLILDEASQQGLWRSLAVRPRHYRRTSPIGLFESLFRSYYVGRVGLEPTTGGL